MRNVAQQNSGDMSLRYLSLRRSHQDCFVILGILHCVVAALFVAGRSPVLNMSSFFPRDRQIGKAKRQVQDALTQWVVVEDTPVSPKPQILWQLTRR